MGEIQLDKIFSGYILATDMDGTLINSNREISKENREAIKYFIENGGLFTLATGRMVQAVRDFAEDLNVNCPIMLHNGAKIYDFKEGKVIKEHYIEEERKEAIKRFYKDNPNIGIEIFSDEIAYVYRKCKFTKRYDRHKDYKVIYELPDEIWKKPWIKVLIIGEKDELDAAEIDFRENYDKGNNSFRSGTNYLDVVANGISKGKSLEELVTALNLDKEKVIAVGDNMNDIEMIEYAKFGFCVENGLDIVKKKANYIATSNDDDAIAYIINKMKQDIEFLS
ncbi:MAG: HAD family phosphatase [Clostridium sp.]|nr:HAD family phosphatase [Clostridium sp.]